MLRWLRQGKGRFGNSDTRTFGHSDNSDVRTFGRFGYSDTRRIGCFRLRRRRSWDVRVRYAGCTSRQSRRDCLRTPHVVLVKGYFDAAMAAPGKRTVRKFGHSDIRTFGQFRRSDVRTVRIFGHSENRMLSVTKAEVLGCSCTVRRVYVPAESPGLFTDSSRRPG